jgi:integrase/recombinase XerD
LRCFKYYDVQPVKAEPSVPSPKKEKHLPVVFSTKEVTALLSRVANLKHKCILRLIYPGGLRISEAIALKVPDIDFSRMQIHIRKAKGKKNRYTLLSKKAATVHLKAVAVLKIGSREQSIVFRHA